MTMELMSATVTHDDDEHCGHLYYVEIKGRMPPPYKTQRRVSAIIDIAYDGTLAGIELVDDMPPPPTRRGDPVGSFDGPIN